MSPSIIAVVMFAAMLVLLLSGQRVFGAIGFVGAVAAVLLWGTGGQELPFDQTITVMNWYPLLTIPLFIYMGYIFAESGISDDLYRTFHVCFGPVRGGLAIGTILGLGIAGAYAGPRYYGSCYPGPRVCDYVGRSCWYNRYGERVCRGGEYRCWRERVCD